MGQDKHEANKVTSENANYTYVLQNADNDRMYYGTSPDFPVVEQNQTYFAYFDGVGGTGPEYIDGTAYFIKYLIDTEGNVVNPEPFTVVDSPQAVGLYNLKDNFEPGKRAIVKLIEPDPTIDEIPNAEILQGTHRIAHVGRIVPVAVSETGENTQDYTTTMSFGATSTQFVEGETSVGNVAARFSFTPAEQFSATGDTPVWTDINFSLSYYINNGSWTNNNPNYTAQSSSADTNTRIDFKIYLYIQAPQDGSSYTNTMYVRLLRNGDPIWTGNGQNIFANTNAYFTWISSWIGTYSEGDEFRVQYIVDNPSQDSYFIIRGTGDSKEWAGLYIRQETPASSGTPGTTIPQVINGINAAFSPYFVGMTNFLRKVIEEGDNEYFEENQAPYNYSFLWMNEPLASMYENGLTQNLDSGSALMGYSPINIPFSDIKPGDFIRFEYDKNKIFTILEVIQDFNPVTTFDDVYTVIKVTPNIEYEPIILNIEEAITNVNHFTIYRVINDGVYVTLDIKKDAPGGAYSGILQPEFVSQELVDKYDKIIQTLTEKEIIQ